MDSNRHPGNSQEQTGPVEAEIADEDPKDAASQDSAFALDQSDISDAEHMGGIQAEVEELAGPLSKKVKRVPPKLAIPAVRGVDHTKTGSNLVGENGGERGISTGPSDNDLMKKSRRAKKSKSSLADAAGQAASKPHFAPISSQGLDTLQLAKAQILNLRYAAADLGIPDYASRVQTILNVRTMPVARWNAYLALANQVDEILKRRGMACIFLDSDVIRTVRPLFQEKGEQVRKPVTSNGGEPKFHTTKPSSRPFTAAQLTISTSSTGAPSNTWTGQSHNTAKTSKTSANTAHHSFAFPATATSAATTVSQPMRKRKHAPMASGAHSASGPTQQSQSSLSQKRKKTSEPMTAGPPVVTCFFCTVSSGSVRCCGNATIKLQLIFAFV